MGEPFSNKTLSETPSQIVPERRLDSWKEIATYLGRDVTTVQRWEKQEGMPVHRHLHHKRGSVYALSSELDAWRQSRKLPSRRGARASPGSCQPKREIGKRQFRGDVAGSFWAPQRWYSLPSFHLPTSQHGAARKGCKPGQNSIFGGASLAELEWRSFAGLRR